MISSTAEIPFNPYSVTVYDEQANVVYLHKAASLDRRFLSIFYVFHAKLSHLMAMAAVRCTLNCVTTKKNAIMVTVQMTIVGKIA